MDPQPTIDAMNEAIGAFAVGDVRDRLHALQAVQHAADAAQARLLAELDTSKDYELDGASTLNTWVRNQLRMNAGAANALVRNATVLRDLPLAGEAALAGQISAAHVQAFVYGLLRRGYALLCGGSIVTGFLNTVTGAKLKKVIDSVSAPDGADDTRTGSERRVQGLDDLLSDILGNGLPSDKGVKPHLSVFVDADTLAAAAEQAKQTSESPFATPELPPVKPATLAGHGAIGMNLLMYFLCVSEFTAFLMKASGGTRQAQILNAGTSKYQPNLLQRRSVIARQRGVCATPGCHHTHLEIHHVIWWSNGGPTDLDQLIGLCVRCHHLLHRGRLHITGNALDGFEFTNRTGRTLRRRRRVTNREAA